MSYDGSGDYSLPAGQPVVTGTTISSTTHNNLANDMATAFDTAFCRDGQAAATALFNMGGFRITNMGAATAVAHAVIASQVQNSGFTHLSSVAGTDTVTGTATPTPAAYAAGQKFLVIPAATNTGATTLNVSSLGAKNVFWNGAACVGGELRQSVPAEVIYDGTQFHIIANGFNAPFSDAHPVVEGSADATKKVRLEVDGLTTATTRVITVPDRDLTLSDAPTLGTEQAATSGTAKDFTSIPSWVKKITISLIGISTNGTSDLRVLLGDAGDVEATGYSGGLSSADGAVALTPTANHSTAFFIVSPMTAAGNYTGKIILTLEDSSDNTWSMLSCVARNDTPAMWLATGHKALSATLDRVRITGNGTDTFDLGAINILIE